MERETRKTSLVMRSRLGHWIRGGKQFSSEASSVGSPKRLTSLVSAHFEERVRLGYYCLTRHCFLRSALLKVIIMSLISQASLPLPLWLLFGELSVSFCFQSCCHCVCVTASCQPLEVFIWMQVGLGGVPQERVVWEPCVHAMERSSFVRVHTVCSRTPVFLWQ